MWIQKVALRFFREIVINQSQKGKKALIDLCVTTIFPKVQHATSNPLIELEEGLMPTLYT